jgi:hypothetical protein
MAEGIAATAEMARTWQIIMGSVFLNVLPILILVVHYFVIPHY